MSCVGLGARLVGFLWGAGLPRFSSRASFCNRFSFLISSFPRFLLFFVALVIVTLIPAVASAVDDELAPLIPIPDKGPNDDLAPLVPPEDTSEPSQLTGQQIRPPSATVMVNHKLDLRVKSCFTYTPEGGSSYIECNPKVVPNDELMPLLEKVTASKWSVNGIEGGNATVGRIKANGNKAAYTAPAKVPKPATVAVSAEISTDGKGKRLVNAEVTIVESVIHASVNFSGRREENGEITDYAGVAEMDFVRADIFNGGVRYDLVTNSPDTRFVINKWDIRFDSIKCHLKSLVTQPSPHTPMPYSGNFFIYSSLNSYIFGGLIDMVGVAVCKDGDSSYQEEINPRVLLALSESPTKLGLQPIPKDEKFMGNITIKFPTDDDDVKVTQTMKWTAIKY